MIHVVVRDLAGTDIKAAQAWYTAEDERTGVRFAAEVTRTIDRIEAMPDQFPEIGQGVRRALLHQFPYAVYFVRQADVAYVIAVLHQRRRPGRWRERIELEPPG